MLKKPYIRNFETGFVLECGKLSDNSNVVFSLKFLYDKCAIKKDSRGLFEIIADDGDNTSILIENMNNKIGSIIDKAKSDENSLPVDFDDYVFGPIKEFEDGKVEDNNETVEVISKHINNYKTKYFTSYYELYDAMRNGCEKNGIYPYYKSLWHLTSVDNLISIIKDGKLIARNFNSESHILHNLYYENETSNNVMKTDKCPKRLRQYVRLYFNPNNPAIFKIITNMKDIEFALIEISHEIISKNKENPILLSWGNAHYMNTCDFDWSRYNLNYQKNIVNYDFFDFEYVYVKNYSNLRDAEKNLLMSEILVHKELDISWIKSIKFRNDYELSAFLKKLPKNNESIRNKCIIDKDAFYGREKVTIDDLFK